VRAIDPGRFEARFADVASAAALDHARFARWVAAWCALSSTWHALDGHDAAAASVARIGERAVSFALDVP
jgi:streptomycin 6-kinase